MAQIRAQLAKIGHPLFGDTLYMHDSNTRLAPRTAIGLQCCKLRVCNLDKEGDWRKAHRSDSLASNVAACGMGCVADLNMQRQEVCHLKRPTGLSPSLTLWQGRGFGR